jgi:hypothetical protein
MDSTHGRFKIAHHIHSGKLRPHEFTSYLPLSLLLLVVGLSLAVCTAHAASPPPQAESVSLTGSMPGKPPKTGATITSPTNQQRFSTSPVTIKGTCPPNTLVEIYKNDIFAGSAACSSTGSFTIDVDLLIGQNVIIARVYDSLNQPGPDSNSVTIYYDALPVQASALASLDFGGPQMILNTDAVFRGSFPEQLTNIPISIIGGTAPYAINVQWGDSTNKVVPRNDNQTFKVGHTYHKSGIYQLTVQGTDVQGRVAFLTVAAIINGQPPVVATASTPTGSSLNKLLVLWPLYTASVAIVISFWLGERREKRILVRSSYPVTPLQSKS